MRMENSSFPHVVLTWAPEGKRKRGRPENHRIGQWRKSEYPPPQPNLAGSWNESGMFAVSSICNLFLKAISKPRFSFISRGDPKITSGTKLRKKGVFS